MKKLIYLFSFALLISCTGVDSGYTGVKVEYGGETDMNQVYPEGLYTGPAWMWNSMVMYETREQTLKVSDIYLDRDGLKVPIDVVVFFKPQVNSVNKLHKDIGTDYINRKISPAVEAALKNVIAQYRALELNTQFREEADFKISDYLKPRFPEFYVDFLNANITKVDIPNEISRQIIEKQVQDERNALAEKKELEQINLANAEIAKAKGQYEAALFTDKTRALLSKPAYLELFRAETERIWAEKGTSPWGTNNVFGDAGVLKGYK
jgi:hypothetical protein